MVYKWVQNYQIFYLYFRNVIKWMKWFYIHFLHPTAVTHCSYMNPKWKGTSLVSFFEVRFASVHGQKPFIANWTSEMTRVSHVSFNSFMALIKLLFWMHVNIVTCRLKSHKFPKMWMINLKTLQNCLIDFVTESAQGCESPGWFILSVRL